MHTLLMVPDSEILTTKSLPSPVWLNDYWMTTDMNLEKTEATNGNLLISFDASSPITEGRAFSCISLISTASTQYAVQERLH